MWGQEDQEQRDDDQEHRDDTEEAYVDKVIKLKDDSKLEEDLESQD